MAKDFLDLESGSGPPHPTPPKNTTPSILPIGITCLQKPKAHPPKYLLALLLPFGLSVLARPHGALQAPLWLQLAC